MEQLMKQVTVAFFMLATAMMASAQDYMHIWKNGSRTTYLVNGIDSIVFERAPVQRQVTLSFGGTEAVMVDAEEVMPSGQSSNGNGQGCWPHTAYDSGGVFVWSATDAVSVFDGTVFSPFGLTEGAGTCIARFTGVLGDADPLFALYPCRDGHRQSKNGNVKFCLPSVYENYASGTSFAPLFLGGVGEGAHFVHLGATLRFVLNALPAGVRKVSISTDASITGESTLSTGGGVPSLAVPDGSGTVTFVLTGETSEGDAIILDLPVLPGTYKAFSIDVRSTGGEILKTCNFIKETQVERAHVKPYNINCASSRLFTDYVDHGIPQLVLLTPGGVTIASKEEYVMGAMATLKDTMGETAMTGAMKVRGRGNSTWLVPKKPYKMKFEEKQSFFDFPKDKEWVLLANYIDKTKMRNDLAFWMAASFGQFEYVPRFRFVDLVLNGKYNGLYQLGEQIKIDEDRVNAGNGGFLLEIDAKADDADVTFRVPHISRPINIKDPDVMVGDADYNYVVDYVTRADASLYAPDWQDPVKGYRSMIDMQSFVEWYLVMEITKNNDAVFHTSCFMSLARDGKLKMGPLWDFDLGMGGYITGREFVNDPEGFYIKTNTGSWIERLFLDPAFT